MSKSLSIFVKSSKDLETFTQALETILEVDFKRLFDDRDVYYEYSDSQRFVRVWVNDFVNDRDLRFEAYDFYIPVGALPLQGSRDRQEACEAFARDIFEKLKATGEFGLMLVEDVQRKLDEFLREE